VGRATLADTDDPEAQPVTLCVQGRCGGRRSPLKESTSRDVGVSHWGLLGAPAVCRAIKRSATAFELGRLSPNEFYACSPDLAGRQETRTRRAGLGSVLPLLLIAAGAALLGQPDGFVSLIPVSDLTEHWTIEGSASDTWSLRDGMIACTGKPDGFLRSRKTYRHFIFRAEWRFQREGWNREPPAYPNAGYFIHAGVIDRTWPRSLEVQGHYGEAGSLFGVRGGSVTGAHRGPVHDNRRPFGEWESIEITSLNGTVTVKLNGKKMNEGHELDPSEGNICLQSEGWPVYYRNVRIRELD